MGKTVRSLLRSRSLTGLGLTPGERLVLLVLVDHADADGVAWPSERTIALESGMQRSGVQKQLPALLAHGVIEKVEKGSSSKSTRYRISPGLWTTQ